MTQENLTFYTLNSTCPAAPIKQRVYLFSHHSPLKTPKNPQRSKRQKKPQPDLTDNAKMHNMWTPHLPSKKLFDDPKFFLSLQRKKFRIINGIKNMSMLSERQPQENVLRGRKLKEGTVSMRRISSSLQPELACEISPRKGWQPSNKTPYLNFNMQYLIKRRKSMTPTPSLYHPTLDKLSKTSSTLLH